MTNRYMRIKGGKTFSESLKEKASAVDEASNSAAFDAAETSLEDLVSSIQMNGSAQDAKPVRKILSMVSALKKKMGESKEESKEKAAEITESAGSDIADELFKVANKLNMNSAKEGSKYALEKSKDLEINGGERLIWKDLAKFLKSF